MKDLKFVSSKTQQRTLLMVKDTLIKTNNIIKENSKKALATYKKQSNNQIEKACVYKCALMKTTKVSKLQSQRCVVAPPPIKKAIASSSALTRPHAFMLKKAKKDTHYLYTKKSKNVIKNIKHSRDNIIIPSSPIDPKQQQQTKHKTFYKVQDQDIIISGIPAFLQKEKQQQQQQQILNTSFNVSASETSIIPLKHDIMFPSLKKDTTASCEKNEITSSPYEDSLKIDEANQRKHNFNAITKNGVGCTFWNNIERKVSSEKKKKDVNINQCTTDAVECWNVQPVPKIKAIEYLHDDGRHNHNFATLNKMNDENELNKNFFLSETKFYDVFSEQHHHHLSNNGNSTYNNNNNIKIANNLTKKDNGVLCDNFNLQNVECLPPLQVQCQPLKPVSINFVPRDPITGREIVRNVVRVTLLSMEDLPRFYFDWEIYNFYLQFSHFPTTKTYLNSKSYDPIGPFPSHSSSNGLTVRCDMVHGVVDLPTIPDMELRATIVQEYEGRTESIGRVRFPVIATNQSSEGMSLKLLIEGTGCVRGFLNAVVSVRWNFDVPEENASLEKVSHLYHDELTTTKKGFLDSSTYQLSCHSQSTNMVWSLLKDVFANPFLSATQNNKDSGSRSERHQRVGRRHQYPIHIFGRPLSVFCMDIPQELCGG